MKTFTLEPTKLKGLFRIVDREGDWTSYFYEPKKKVLRSVSSILDDGYPKGKGLEMWLANKSKAEIDAIKKEKSGEGDRTHQFIDTVLTSSGVAGVGNVFDRDEVLVLDKNTGQMVRLNNEEWDAVLSWAEFWNRHEPILLLNETPVFDLKLEYAGTLDAALVLTKACGVRSCGCADLIGLVGIFDWKKSAGIYESYSAQLGAYAHAPSLFPLMNGNKPDYAANVRLATNHKTTGGYELAAYIDLAEIFDRFLAAKRIADHEYKPFSFEQIEEIPDSVVVNVKREELKRPKGAKKNAES